MSGPRLGQGPPKPYFTLAVHTSPEPTSQGHKLLTQQAHHRLEDLPSRVLQPPFSPSQFHPAGLRVSCTGSVLCLLNCIEV